MSLPFCIDKNADLPDQLIYDARPRLKIRSITSDGIVTVQFSERLLVPNEIDESYLKEFAIRVDVAPVEGQSLEDVNFDW